MALGPGPAPTPPTPLIRIEPGWLFLVAGVLLIAAAVLIPAHEEFEEVRWQRDRAAALEEHRLARLENYRDYLDALDRRDPTLVQSLAASQLRQIPAGRTPLTELSSLESRNASVFPALEPAPVRMPKLGRNESLLARLTRGDASRPWIYAAGGFFVLLGILPPIKPRA